MELARLQALFARLIAAPEGVAASLCEAPSVRLEELVVGDERLDAVARLDIYANAYFYRLLDALKEDYPATLAMLGETDFHNLITGYLLEYPPSAPSIFYAGQHLAGFLQGHPLSKPRPYLAELATLERTLLDSFHSVDAVPLEPADIAAIAPEDWPALKLRPHPSLLILDLNWRVDRVLRAVEAGESTGPPAAASAAVLVWRRRDLQASYRPLEADERAALKLVRESVTFAAICEAIASVGHTDDLPARINRMLGCWLADGLLVRGA